jgi:MinD-like ATPase involved in chromosome partitioning or flagellar assembly
MNTQPIRIVVGLGDPERERRLLPALAEYEDVRVVERCLSADQLLDAATTGRADVALVAFDLHRLGSGALSDLEATRVPRVLLVRDPNDPRWESQRGVVLPIEADADVVRRAVEAAVRGERFSLNGVTHEVVEPLEAQPGQAVTDAPTQTLSVIGICSGPGSPGRTTVAVNLAAALGAVVPTVLVDADLAGPSIAAQLDADPTRNLYMVAHAEPEAAWEWDRAIQSEVQPLDRNRSPHADVLCGVPKPDMRGRITRRFIERLVDSLQRRYRYVILDTGGELIGPEGTVHRAAVGLSQQVLLVCSSDLVGLWRARTTLGLLQTHLQVSLERVALVVNRHDPRFHHGRTEIEWALGAATACVVPYDHLGLERALAAQRPAVLGRGAAGKALLDFAERLHGGKVVLASGPERADRRRWPRLPSLKPPSRSRRGEPALTSEADG